MIFDNYFFIKMVFTWNELLDIYSPEYKLRFKGNKNYNSFLGQLMGTFTLLIFISLYIINIIDFCKRKNFDVYYNINFQDDYTINITNYPFLFALTDENNNFIQYNESLFKIYLIYIQQTFYNYSIKPEINYKVYNLETCDENQFSNKEYNELMKKYSKSILKHVKCLPKNVELLIKGRMGINNSYIQLGISKCNKNENSNCETNYNDSKIKSASLVISYLSYSIDHKSYLKPIKKKFEGDIIPISLNLIKICTYSLELTKYISDDGTFLSHEKTYDFFQPISKIFDYQINEENENLIVIRFVSSNNYHNFYRIYKKFQDYLAIFESYCHGIYICIHFLADYLLLKLKNRDIVNEIFFPERMKEFKGKKVKYKIDSKCNIKLKNNINDLSEIKQPIKYFSTSCEKNISENPKKNSVFVFENKNISLYQKYLKPLSYKIKHYILPFFIIKNDKTILIIDSLKEKIDKKISIEILFFNEICKNKENILNDIYSNEIIKYLF